MKLNISNMAKTISFIALSMFLLSLNNKSNTSFTFDKQETEIAKQNIVG